MSVYTSAKCGHCGEKWTSFNPSVPCGIFGPPVISCIHCQYNFTGKLLETTNNTSLSLADYPIGIYLLKVAYGDRVEQLKVVKD